MSKLVLVVEDETALRDILLKLLTREGYIPLGAGDGASGLEIVKTNPPALIFLDLLMPKMDGNQFLVELNKIAPYINVIVMTATPGKLVANSQVKKILSKPFTMSEFLAVVREWV